MKMEGGSLFVYITCEIDHHTAKKIRESVDTELARAMPKELIFDFSGVGFMDSSGIGLILGRLEKAQSVGATLVVRGLSPTLRKLVRISGIEKLKSLSVI
ncbi:MAG: anti-sigma factor antagonist [Clostridia bacterium]|nr:anti-sigma factor antagonist [Clostridia bacterium]